MLPLAAKRSNTFVDVLRLSLSRLVFLNLNRLINPLPYWNGALSNLVHQHLNDLSVNELAFFVNGFGSSIGIVALAKDVKPNCS